MLEDRDRRITELTAEVQRLRAELQQECRSNVLHGLATYPSTITTPIVRDARNPLHITLSRSERAVGGHVIFHKILDWPSSAGINEQIDLAEVRLSQQEGQRFIDVRFRVVPRK